MLSTPLSVEESVKRLVESVTKKNVWMQIFDSSKVVGKFGRTTFFLWVTPQANSWRSYFRGELQRADTGTLISGQFDISRFTKVFSVCWLTGVFLFFIFGLIIFATSESTSRTETLPFIFIPLGMIFLCTLLIRWCIWQGEQRQEEVIHFIEDTLGATLVVPVVERTS